MSAFVLGGVGDDVVLDSKLLERDWSALDMICPEEFLKTHQFAA